VTRGINVDHLDKAIAELAQPCSSFFKWEDLILAGETARAHPEDNIPRQIQTREALQSLASLILDPIASEISKPRLTYGLSCAGIVNRIAKRIAPAVDQHSSFECWSNGNRICSLGGAAVDFFVEGRTASEVAVFVVETLPFDALYFYGDDRPIHVSWSQTPRNVAVEMKFNAAHQRYFPVRRTPKRFLELHGR